MSRLSSLTSIGRIFTCQRNYHSSQVFSARGKDYIYSTPTSIPSPKIGAQQYSSPTQPSRQFKQDRKFENVSFHIYDKDPPLIRQLALNENDVLNIIESTDSKDVNLRVFKIMSKVLFGHTRGVRSTSALKNILNSVGMQKYSKLVSSLAPSLDSGDLIEVFKIFAQLQSPGLDPTFESVQRLLAKSAHSLPINQLLYLDFLLDKMEDISRSPVTRALKIAIPIIFESQLDLYLDKTTNPREIAKCLSFVSKHNFSDTVCQKLSNIITQLDVSTLTEREIGNLLWTLPDIGGDSNSFSEIVPSLLKISTKDVEKMDPERVSIIVSKFTGKIMRGESFWYNADWMEAACQRVNTFKAEKLLYFLKKTTSLIGHVNIDLMETACNRVAENPSVILNNDYFFGILLRSLCTCDHKPEKWDVLRPIMMEHPSLTKSFAEEDIELVLHFLGLDILLETLVKRIFDPKNVTIVNTYIGKHGPLQLLLIANAITYLHPDYDGPRPSDETIEQWEMMHMKKKAKKSSPLEPFLQTALGGEKYILSPVYHKGLYIDHCLVMRYGGYPIAVKDSQNIRLDDIDKPPNSSLILIRVFGPGAYARNTRKLRGLFNLEARILRTSGHPLLEVNKTVWNEFSDKEKIPWLMQTIRQNTEIIPYNNY